MEKILGIDTGTNSLGWAVLEKNENGTCKLLEHGTNIFKEGVKIEKNNESSRAAERTKYRSLRKLYWRRKIRKIRLLNVLLDYKLCPPFSKEELRGWRLYKLYPTNEEFLRWQSTEDKENCNPYHYRYICLTQKLDLEIPVQRYILGRAFYHLNQRRGFLSNRKETTKENDDGVVKSSISQLTTDIENEGCSYLGEYFYKLYQRGEKIRNKYTARKEHYLKEFRAICEKQELSEELTQKLEKAIFDQRPLKSQKQQIGKCVFETKKARCSTSHPLFEDFRMYSFINNIKIKTPTDEELRPLLDEEVDLIVPLFLRKSKKIFKFEEIAKKISGKGKYVYIHDKVDKPYKFNYHLDTLVSGSPVNAQLAEIFGNEWLDAVCEVYTNGAHKTRIEILNDIWHVLFNYDDEGHLKQFAINRLQLNEEDATKFSKIKMPQDYSSLSLCAIKKILPFLRKYHLLYSEAVFLANLSAVLPTHVWGLKEMRDVVIDSLIEVMHDKDSTSNLESRVKIFLKEQYDVSDKSLEKLYHPSMIDIYPRQRPNDLGLYQLGSPRTNSVRNPMAMHSLFRLRKVVNLLLKEGKIDENTKIQIEFSRDLNDANKRAAIKDYQSVNEKNKIKYYEELVKLFKDNGLVREPVDNDLLKFQLWEEQNHRCIYTGKEIGVVDLFGCNPCFDIEHTIPRSAGGDTTKMNLTICDSRFNRDIKKTNLPSSLSNHDEILSRIQFWKDEYEKLDAQIRKLKGSSASTKEGKDEIIRKRHFLKLKRDYWKGKYQRFTIEEVPEGFSRRQGTDISVISRYARLYLKTVFKKVYIVKGLITSDFRKIWGIQDEYSKKVRDNHVHHCIDAITVACIGKKEYDNLANYYRNLESYEKYGKNKPHFDKPWPTFSEDIKCIQNGLLVAHYSQDNMPKKAKRRIVTSRGKIIAQGDVARCCLHKETYYGKIMDNEGNIKTVIRKSISELSRADLKYIVDPIVSSIILEAISAGKDLEKDDIWMNKEKGIRIKKVRCYCTNQHKTLDIKKQRDFSQHDYKQHYHVWNDGNYMLAIYEGVDSKGKIKRESEEVNMLDAARYFRRSNKEESRSYGLIPQKSVNNYDLKYVLKVGTMVLFYENSPEEIWESSKEDLSKRLYKIIGMSKADGRIALVHHQEARKMSEVPRKDGAFKINETFRPKIRISINQFKALVNGYHFELNDLGDVKRLM